MRILFTRFPLESADGGAENQTMWLAEGLKKRGHDVSFVGSCRVLLRRFQEKGLLTIPKTIGVPPVTLWSAISFFWRKSEMKKILITTLASLPEKPDAILMLSLSEKILLTRYAAKKGIRVFWVEHDRIGRWLTRNPWLSALKHASKNATIICVSELSRQMYVDLGFDPSRVIAIPNGVPIPSQTLAKKQSSEVLHIGSVARLSPEKGLDVLIHSIAESPAINLTIVGQGKEEGYLRTLITEDGQRIGTHRITLTPRVGGLPEFYQSLDVFVLPSSDHDPFGLVAAEAMLFGIPTIVTTMCGIAGYLENGTEAIVVEAGSPQALEKAFITLADPQTRHRIGEAGATAVRAKFSVETMVENYEKTLTSLRDAPPLSC